MKSARFTLKVFLYVTLINFSILSTAQAQEAPPNPPKLIRKAGGVLMSQAVDKPAPAYPPLAKTARISGAVVVEVTVNEEGSVIAARALSGHPLLKDSAVSAAEKWTFKPTTLSGVPVKVIGTITFNFNMDHSQDIEALREQIAARPNSAELHRKIGQLYSFDGQHESAIASFQQALDLEPDKPINYFGLGRSYANAGRLDEAAQYYKQGLGMKPESSQEVEARIALGKVYSRQERNSEAVEEYKQAIAINPYSQEARMQLGMLFAKIGDKESAMEEYKILKKMNSPMADMVLRSINKDR